MRPVYETRRIVYTRRMETARNERGRPRDESVDRAVIEATRSVLARDGWEGLSIERVAREAGVGKTSVYRRWPNKTALVLDATLEVLLEVDPDSTTSEALEQLIDSTARDFERPDFRAALPGLVAMCLSDPGEMNRRRIQPEIRLVGKALAADGDEKAAMKDDAALIFELYVGAILMRVLRGERPTPAYRTELRRFLLTGLEGPG